MKIWVLEDIEKSAKMNPYTFFIPPMEERNNQKLGDVVRLHFILKNPKDEEPRAERMWVVIINDKNLSGKFVGILRNKPLYIKDLQIGDKIEF